jgi:hypothetical protein
MKSHFQLFAVLLFAGIAHGGPVTGLPACASKYDLGCQALTTGGYTVLQSISSPNGTMYTEVYQVLTGGTIIGQAEFLTANGPGIQSQVLQFETQLATAPPACSSNTASNCYAQNPGGGVSVTSSTTSSYVNGGTALTQRIDQYATTIEIKLNGTQTLLMQTFGLASNDPVVQAAIQQAEASAINASFGTPSLLSGSSVLTSSLLTYVPTQVPTGNTSTTTVQTFGPATVNVGGNQTELFYVLPGQLDINVNTNNEYFRNPLTTNTYLTTQSYEILGTSGSGSVPEPASFAMVALGLSAAACWRRRRKGSPCCRW